MIRRFRKILFSKREGGSFFFILPQRRYPNLLYGCDTQKKIGTKQLNYLKLHDYNVFRNIKFRVKKMLLLEVCVSFHAPQGTSMRRNSECVKTLSRVNKISLIFIEAILRWSHCHCRTMWTSLQKPMFQSLSHLENGPLRHNHARWIRQRHIKSVVAHQTSLYSP